jgi:hypothetical protein
MRHLPTELRDHLNTESFISVANCNVSSKLQIGTSAYSV